LLERPSIDKAFGWKQVFLPRSSFTVATFIQGFSPTSTLIKKPPLEPDLKSTEFNCIITMTLKTIFSMRISLFLNGTDANGEQP
jgi:hypothetical protein